MPFIVISQGAAADRTIILQNADRSCEAEIYCFGGLLNAFRIQTSRGFINTVDAFASTRDAQEHITNGFKSAKLSPYPCRMQEGRYQYKGQEYKVEKFYMKQHAIHGIIYDAVYHVEATSSDEHQASVVLAYAYKGTDKGYPFPFDVRIEWTLHKNNKLTATTTVINRSDMTIPFAEGWHPYFKLDAPVDECTLQFDAPTMLEFDETLVPTGQLLPDDRFLSPRLMKNVELDNCFVLDPLTTHAGCVLSSQQLRLSITPAKSYPYLQIYTPPHRQSIAIENLSGAPNTFNNGIGLQLLEKDQPAVFSTTYCLETL